MQPMLLGLNHAIFSLFRHAEGRQILRHGRQLVEAGVKGLVAAAVGFEALDHLGIRAADGDEAENFVGILLRKADVLDEDDADLVRADLVKLVHRAHDIAGPRSGNRLQFV